MRQAENWERVPWYNYDNTRATELTMVQDWSVCVSCFAKGRAHCRSSKKPLHQSSFFLYNSNCYNSIDRVIVRNIKHYIVRWAMRVEGCIEHMNRWKQRIHSFAIPTYISDTNLDSWAKYLPWHNSSLRFRWWIALLTNIQASIIGIYWLQTIKRIKRKEEYEKNHIQPLSLKANRIC